MREVFQRIGAVTWLTLQAALRLRVVLALGGLLGVGIALLPQLIRHNGTASMFAQVLLTYSLYLCTGLLSLSTLWIACGIHSTDIEPGQLQLLAVKPAARWQIWMGRWCGIAIINTGMLLLAGAVGCGVLYWQARQLDPEQQQHLKDEVLVARASAREPMPDLDRDVEKALVIREKEGTMEGVDPALARRELREQLKARHEVIAPNFRRLWDVDMTGRRESLAGRPLQVRVYFHAAEPVRDALLETVWVVGRREDPKAWRATRSLSPGVVHEFTVPAELIDDSGRLHVECENRAEQTLLFPLDTGLEVLFPDGGFLLNYARALMVIWCWLALLTSIGLFAATFLSFGIAGVLTLVLLVVAVSGDTFAEVVRDGTVLGVDHETGRPVQTPANAVTLPIYRFLGWMLSPFDAVSPVASLSEGRSIPWRDVVSSFGAIVLLLGGGTAAAGMAIFARRELAGEQ
jgi:ABC-type transport system involved in multi-copper enzyme maturation permease subunit